jgi:xylulokinase
MSKGFLLGIDVGTSGLKALLIDRAGKVITSALVEYPLDTPKPGWAEQDPEAWWKATVRAIGLLRKQAKIKGGDITGVGLTGQMHGSVFLDKDNRVIRPALLWCDQRTAAECDEIVQRVGGLPELLRLTGNQALTGFTAPKVLWLRNQEPHHFERVRRLLLPKDYIRFRLTGEFAIDVADASGTLLFDVKARTWSNAVLDRLGIRRDILPTAMESPAVSGRVTEAGAKATGLAPGTPVVAGAGDQAAGGVGNGIVREGIISSSLGTSGVMFAFAREPNVDSQGRLHTFCHGVPGAWHVMGVMLSAGGSFRWYRDALNADLLDVAKKKRVDPYELMTAEAKNIPAGGEGLFFLPYIMGERTPYPDPHARGVFFGIHARHRRPHFTRAVMEGVTFGLRDSLELMALLNIPVREIRASGGGAKSPFWCQMQADIFNAPVVTINVNEGPAFGAALLAAVGTGAFAGVPEACDATIRVVKRWKPDPKLVSTYDELYGIYRTLYGALKDRFEALAKVIR